MNVLTMIQLISFVMAAHADSQTKDPVRRWDKNTPYSIHPIWCAMTLLHETKLPEDLRVRGSQALLLHDIIEDTNAAIPQIVVPGVIALVKDMTFSSSAAEFEEIWGKSFEVKLFKLYDKTSNLMDGSWMPDEKWNKYCVLTGRLAEIAHAQYGMLNIVKIAGEIAQRR